jgi:hypothetical protein
LAAQQQADVVPLMLLVLKNRPALRSSAIEAILKMNAREAAPELARILGDLPDGERHEILGALGRLENPQTAPQIRPASELRKRVRPLRRLSRAGRGRGSRGRHAAPSAARRRRSPGPAGCGGGTGPAQGPLPPPAPFARGWADPKAEVRAAAAAALQGVDDEETVTALLERLDDEEEVRGRVIEALGWGPRARDEIRRRLKDPDAERRAAAIHAARAARDTASIPAFLESLEHGPPGARPGRGRCPDRVFRGPGSAGNLALVPEHGDAAIEQLVALRALEAIDP